jgi:hypothetical protein
MQEKGCTVYRNVLDCIVMINEKTKEIKMETKKYLSVVETAKLIRKGLKANFPGVKFSVRSESYAGGASINVEYTNGPLTKNVEAYVKQYEGAGFDGMTDYKYYMSHYMNTITGEICLAKCEQTYSSQEVNEEMPEGEGWVAVSFGADYVFVRQNVTKEIVEEAIEISENQHPQIKGLIEVYEGYSGADINTTALLEKLHHSNEAQWLNNQVYKNIKLVSQANYIMGG